MESQEVVPRTSHRVFWFMSSGMEYVFRGMQPWSIFLEILTKKPKPKQRSTNNSHQKFLKSTLCFTASFLAPGKKYNKVFYSEIRKGMCSKMGDVGHLILGDMHICGQWRIPGLSKPSWLSCMLGKDLETLHEVFINEAQQRNQNAFFSSNQMVNSALEIMESNCCILQ